MANACCIFIIFLCIAIIAGVVTAVTIVLTRSKYKDILTLESMTDYEKQVFLSNLNITKCALLYEPSKEVD